MSRYTRNVNAKPRVAIDPSYVLHPRPGTLNPKGIDRDRDRAVDGRANQIAFSAAARPFTREEATHLYLHNGKPYTIPNDPPK
jgi:hypothetical protein